jgi:hypothetical protein
MVEQLHAHLRYCAEVLNNGDRVEILLCELGVIVPIIKRVRQNKASTLDLLARSSSIGRDRLISLRDRLVLDGHVLKTSVTLKQRLLSRIVIPLPTDDPFFPVTAVAVLRSIAAELDASWPCTLTIGYALGLESHDLPGRLVYRDPVPRAGYQIGSAIGNIVRKIIT